MTQVQAKHTNYKINGPIPAKDRFILSSEAMKFLAEMELFARSRRKELLQLRQKRQEAFDAGTYPHFLEETKSIREGDWRLNNTPADLIDRRVEITGPVDRKMIINALNSGAKVFMADCEDSNSPTWENCLAGQVNLYDAVRKTISYSDPTSDKKYQLNPQTAVLIVRPRGWHLDESHVLVDNEPVSGSLFDSMLYLFHNAKELLARGSGPYFYLPKLESHEEARLWNDVFIKAQKYLGIPKGSIKVTVLIETITAAFEMDEIIYELGDHIVGLNCGRWDYIFSYIKKFRNHPEFILPDRQQVTMTAPFLKAYVNLLIQICHKRGIHAMGGMAAQIPIKNDEEANQQAMDSVYADKKREALAGHDGTWVAHPGLVPLALKAFDAFMPQANQLDKMPEGFVTEADLLAVPKGEITEQGVRGNITVGILYIESWLKGNGCVPIRNLMEDAATAEICRAQLWQWCKFSAVLNNGSKLTPELLQQWIDEEYALLKNEYHQSKQTTHYLKSAKELFEQMIFKQEFDDFLTTQAYSHLIKS